MNNLSFIDDSYPNLAESSRFSSAQVSNHGTANKQRPKFSIRSLSFDSFKIKNANIALAILCTCAFWQNMLVGGANNAILTTIERAFYMKSIESALFLSCYDIGNILTSPFISYLGDRIHKPKIIGLSMIGLSIGSFIMTVPEFINFDFSTIVNTNEELNKSYSGSLICVAASNFSSINNSNSTFKPSKSSSSMNDMKYVFYIANTINGISSVALYTIVISYIENIFEKDKVHMRQGIYYAIGAIGVGMGMIITGAFLNLNGTKNSKSNKNSFSNSDHFQNSSNNVNWIGAWYMIFMLGAVFNFILAFLVMQFSPSLTLDKEIRPVSSQITENTNNDIDSVIANTNSQTNLNKIPQQDKNSLKEHFKKFWKDAKLILSNKIFLFIVICTTCETFLIKGFSSYLTKYLEYEYRLPASSATILTGTIGFISMIGGALLGSYLIAKFKWKIKECSRFVTVILFFTSFLFLGVLIHCKQEVYINSESLIFQQSKCECDANKFNPVCYKEKFLFQTPCFAGCTSSTSKMYSNAYTNCSVLQVLASTNQSLSISECSRPTKHCKHNLVIVGFVGLGILFLSAIIILPLLRIILESVGLDNQSFALGIRSFITKLFGNIPGPIVFASIVDRACVQWTKSPLTPNKTCRLYENMLFSKGLGLMGFFMRFLSFIFAFITMLHVNKVDSIEIEQIHNFDKERASGENNQAFKLNSINNDDDLLN